MIAGRLVLLVRSSLLGHYLVLFVRVTSSLVPFRSGYLSPVSPERLLFLYDRQNPLNAVEDHS